MRLAVGARASLAWLPQETILFDRARLERTIEVDLAEDARLLLAEAIVFGRSGMGEAVTTAGCSIAGGCDAMASSSTPRPCGSTAPSRRKLAQPAVAKGGVAVATVLVVPGDEALTAAVRALGNISAARSASPPGTGSRWSRLCAADGAALRHDLVAVLAAVRGARCRGCG